MTEILSAMPPQQQIQFVIGFIVGAFACVGIIKLVGHSFWLTMIVLGCFIVVVYSAIDWSNIPL